MPFTMTPNVAQYKGADWSSFIEVVPNCTPQSAQRIAMLDPNIAFFFYCRQGMVLEGVKQNAGVFHPSDAVFFSGASWFGSAPQCDVYTKNFVNVAYATRQGIDLNHVACYELSDGRPFFDIACRFASNI